MQAVERGERGVKASKAIDMMHVLQADIHTTAETFFKLNFNRFIR
jgi:hypothetical protein